MNRTLGWILAALIIVVLGACALAPFFLPRDREGGR